MEHCWYTNSDPTKKWLHKNRPPKPHDVQKRDPHSSNNQVDFELVGRGQRTAKHKKASPSSWIPDSGATISCTNRIDLFETVEDYSPDRKVLVASGHYVTVQAIGTIRLNLVDTKGKPCTVLLRNVCYSPHFTHNLLSVRELYNQHRISTSFGKSCSLRMSDGQRFRLQPTADNSYHVTAFQALTVDANMWHKRFMHAGEDHMRNVSKHIAQLQGGAQLSFPQCDACLQGGSRRHSYKRRHPAFFRKIKAYTYFGECISSDLCGPFPESIEGDYYAIVFHDRFTKHIAVYTLPDKTKESVLDAFEKFMLDYQDQLTRGINLFHTDNGGEYLNRDMDQFCEELCIKRSYTVPYEPPQNPYAERAWGTVLRKVRTSLADARLPDAFWSYAIRQAAVVHNAMCDSSGTSPYFRVHQTVFPYETIHVFGCLGYFLLPRSDRKSKVSPTSLHCIYLGTDPLRRGYAVYIPSSRKLTTGYHVVFNEHKFFEFDKTFDGKQVAFDDLDDIIPNLPVEGSVSSGYRHHARRPDKQHATTSEADCKACRGQHRRHTCGKRGSSRGERSVVNEERDNDPIQPLPVPAQPIDDQQNDDSDEEIDTDPDDRDFFEERQCEERHCTYPKGHDGPHSNHEVDDRFRKRTPIQQQRLYAECAHSCCTLSDDHDGKCINDEGHGIFDSLCFVCEDEGSDDDDDDLEEYMVHYVVDEVSGCAYSVDLSTGELSCPNGYEETQRGPLKPRWDESMSKEYQDLRLHETWVTVSRKDPRLQGRKPTKSRWVYTIKYNRDGTIERFKSRFVVCGYSQRQGIDYDRAFSATLRATSFRTLLAISAGKKLHLEHFDVTSAFTQANLDDVYLFVEPPKGFEEWETPDGKPIPPGYKGEKVSKLLLLRKALYGTKQASRLWQDTLREFLCDPKGLAMSNSKHDPCLFHLERNGETLIIGIYVDDIVVAHGGGKLFEHFKSKFLERFRAKHIGPLNWFLGMGIDQGKNFEVDVSQEAYIDKMAKKFIPGNTQTRECPPVEIFTRLDRAKDDTERAKAKELPYLSLVGALLYAAVMSRPDIAYHASVLSKFMSDPSPDCYHAAIQLLQYLHGTRQKTLHFSGKVSVPDGLQKVGSDIENNHGFVAYSDSSWGNKYPYPMFGYGIYLFGGLVSFASKQLKVVAFSSCEAEYAAASYCCKEIEFVRNICSDLGVTLHGRLILALDNTAAIDVAHDRGVSGRTKHFNMAMHYIRDLTEIRRILPTFVSTILQRADGYTKALDKSKYLKWIQYVVHR